MAILKSTSRPTWHIRSMRSAVAAGLLLAGGLLPAAYAATPLEQGFLGPSFGGSSVREPTGPKPESKLWFHDGAWWASMYSSDNPEGAALGPGYYAFKLNRTTNEWERQ